MKRIDTTNILLVGIIFMFFWMAYTTYLRYQPFQAPTLTVSPMKVLTKEVSPGSTVRYQSDYCIYRKVPTETSRRLVQLGAQGNTYFLSVTLSGGSEPGCNKSTLGFPIPLDVEPGKYKIENISKFTVNQLQAATRIFETEAFIIKEASKGAQTNAR